MKQSEQGKERRRRIDLLDWFAIYRWI